MTRTPRRWSRSFRSLRGRMLALALPVSVLSFLVLTAWFERAASDRHRRLLEEEIERTAGLGAEVLAAPLWYVNGATVRANLEVLLSHGDVKAALVRDTEGSLFAWCSELLDDAESLHHTVQCGQEEGPGAWDNPSWQRHVETIGFAQIGAEEEIGELELRYSDVRLSELRAERLRGSALFFAGLVLTLMASIFLVTRRALLMPLHRWREAIRAHRGQGLQTVEWSSADEIGELIREYNERVNEEHDKVADLVDRMKSFEDAFQSLDRGLCIFDRDFQLLAYNQRYLELMGHTEDSVETGMGLKDLLRRNAANGEYGSADVDAVIIDRLAIAAAGEAYSRERQRDDGTMIEVDTTPTPDGGFVSLYSDVTKQRNLEAQMRRMTLHDTLTGLPNRALFHDRLRQSLALADRLGTRLALLLIDVDDFRKINEAYGNEIGDLVLKEIGDRLRQLGRKSDTVARLEADQFAMIQQYLPSFDDAGLLAHRIRGSLSRAFELGKKSLNLSVAIGITVYPNDDVTSRNIVKNAHLALTAAKAEGRRYRFFVPEVDRDVAERRRLEEELFTGLREKQFVLHYQPRVDLGTRALVSVEARLRWRHPERGLLPPSEFMDLAEERGLVVPLCDWMLEEACRCRRDWQSRAQGSWRVTVPISGRRFAEGNLVSSIRSIVEKTGFDYRFLEVEISCNVLLGSVDQVSDDLRALRNLGVRAILDDFGNGGSSIGSLRHLPVDVVKIDRRLIHDYRSDDQAAAIVRASIDIARRLELRIGAAGVEEPEQLDSLRDDGCDEALGQAVSPPLDDAELAKWIETHSASTGYSSSAGNGGVDEGVSQ